MSKPRAILPSDRRRISAQLRLEAQSGRYNPRRLRAFVLLAWTAGLRLREVLALEIGQVLETMPDPKQPKLRLRAIGYLRGPQSKGRRNGERKWDSGGQFVLTRPARDALRSYLSTALRIGVLAHPLDPRASLWHTQRGGPVSERAVQYAWHTLQQHAGIVERYHFHALRHDALTRFAEASGGDVFRVAAFGRCDVLTAARYVHASPAAVSSLAERAASL